MIKHSFSPAVMGEEDDSQTHDSLVIRSHCCMTMCMHIQQTYISKLKTAVQVTTLTSRHD